MDSLPQQAAPSSLHPFPLISSTPTRYEYNWVGKYSFHSRLSRGAAAALTHRPARARPASRYRPQHATSPNKDGDTLHGPGVRPRYVGPVRVCACTRAFPPKQDCVCTTRLSGSFSLQCFFVCVFNPLSCFSSSLKPINFTALPVIIQTCACPRSLSRSPSTSHTHTLKLSTQAAFVR